MFDRVCLSVLAITPKAMNGTETSISVASLGKCWGFFFVSRK